MRYLCSIFLLTVFCHSISGQQLCGTKVTEAIPVNDLIEPVLRNDDLRITVVFHIILPEGHTGITNAQLWSQIDALNRDFNLDNPDLVYADPHFASSIGNAHIEFCLAEQDPSGNESQGFTRRSTNIENLGQSIFEDGRRRVHYDVLGGIDPWDPEKYLNVWIAEMESFSGRSSFPEEGPSQEDGIVIDPDFLGSFGNTQNGFGKGRTLVHEVGHYLGLLHPWVEEGCEKDDEIEDTPLQNGPYFNCAESSDAQSCGSRDMIHNFMQYGFDNCLLYFTKDQIALMRSVLMNYRNGLIDQSGNSDCGNAALTEEPIVYYDPELQAVRFLSIPSDEVVEYSIMDMSGRQLAGGKISGYYIPTLDLHYYPNGVYIISVQYNQRTFTQKILKYD